MAPTLFNIYASALMSHWRRNCSEAGIDVRYRIGRRLVGDGTEKSKLDRVKMTELQFADDAALLTSTRAAFVSATNSFADAASEWGMTVSASKTKGMRIGNPHSAEDLQPVVIDGGGSIKMVSSFSYLGSVVYTNCEVKEEVGIRTAKASRAFGSINFCQQQTFYGDQEKCVQSCRAPSAVLWCRNLDSQIRHHQKNDTLPQPVCEIDHGCQQIQTMQGEDYN